MPHHWPAPPSVTVVQLPRGIPRYALALLASIPTALALWWLFGPFTVSRTVALAPATIVPDGTRLVWTGEARPGSGVWMNQTHADVPPPRFALPARGITSLALHPPDGVTVRPNPALVTIEDVWLGRPIRTHVVRLTPGADASSLRAPVPSTLALLVVDAVAAWCVGALVALLVARAWSVAPSPLPCRVDPPSRGHWYAIGVVGGVHTAWALASPLMFCPDSMDYFVRAREWLDAGSFAVFDTWRPPGFAVLIAGLLTLRSDTTPLLGALHALMAVGTAGMAGGIVRRWAGGPWPIVAIVLVGIDPVVLLWSRHAMPEMSAMFLATLGAWAAVRVGCAPSRRRAILWAMTAGVAAGLGAYVRSNLQVLVVIVPVLVLARYSPQGLRRGAALAGACLLAGVATLAPWMILNFAREGVPALTIGTNFARTLAATDAGLFDMNQTQWRQRPMNWKTEWNGFAVADHAARIGVHAESAPASGEPATAQERRLGVLLDESFARRPDRRWWCAGGAFLSVSGLAPLGSDGYRENSWWARPLSGDADSTRCRNFWNEPGDYRHLSAPRSVSVYDTHKRDVSEWTASVGARVFSRWWGAWTWVHPGLAWAALALMIRSALRKDWAVCALSALPPAHAAAVALVTLSGIDRYQSPLVPITTAVAVLGAATLTRRILGRRSEVAP